MRRSGPVRRVYYLCWFSIFLGSCGSPGQANTAEGKLPAEGQTIPVGTYDLSLRKFEYLVKGSGKIRSLRDQVFFSESNGVLIRNITKSGSTVSAGSVLVMLETASVEYRLEKARLTRFNAEKEYESQLLGYTNLLTGKSAEQADQIRQKLRISTGLALAEEDIKEAIHDLQKATIKAPFSGMLADVMIDEGQQLKAGEKMFRLYDPTQLQLEVNILESDIPLINIGSIATITPLSAPSLQYAAVVREINPYVDEHGMVLVKLQIKNTSRTNKLFPGMNCQAVIRAPRENALVIPRDAVVMRANRAVVFSLDNGKAKWNYVTPGRDNGEEIEIRDGLKPGMQIITANNLQLAHDAPVRDTSSRVAIKK